MKVEEIIKAVRWCIDEESNNTSEITDEKDDLYMDNIIKSKINDALHWIAITAASSPVLSDSKKVDATTTSTIKVESFDDTRGIGAIKMPSDTEVINISRVRGEGWFKAVTPVEDTDDEALMMYDDTAKGTADRPLATIMRENPIRILLQPIQKEAVISFVGVPKNVSITSDTTDVAIPDKLSNAFIYYLAFLLLSAYDDTKANQMYTIALQQLGVSTK
uniref:phage adaptor protein n=1 Tax=Prevotella sp. TaxID=59823 RepID=UPI0025FD102B